MPIILMKKRGLLRILLLAEISPSLGRLGQHKAGDTLGEIGNLMRKIERKARKAAEVAALGRSLTKRIF